MKLSLYKHQQVGVDLLANNPKFLLGAEQGTGKTAMILADAENKFNAGLIDALFVVAPKGVHSAWVLNEIPKHLSVPHISAYYSSGASKKLLKKIDAVFAPSEERKLRILTMNIDSICFGGGSVALKFLRQFRCIFALDESSRIKDPEANRTKKAIQLSKHAKYLRAASGTPITNSPTDIFAQFQFLGLNVLGTSYRAFVAEYSVLLPEDNALVKDIASRTRGNPQIVQRDRNGAPMYRNLEKLNRLIAPYMYRVTKKECLDLPDKIYKIMSFELTSAQREVYDRMDNDLNRIRDDGDLDVYTALTKLGKMRQCTSGFVLSDGEVVLMDSNPRMDLLKEIVKDLNGKFIIWAQYKAEIALIRHVLNDLKISAVDYYGETTNADRLKAIDEFQNGDAQCFVSNPSAGGIGLTLTAATTAIYYSNDFSLEKRLQSEDRCHRIGTSEHVLYIDIAAADTIDERIALALQRKEEVAEVIIGKR